MPKGVKRLEHEIADWQHYKKMGSWLDGKQPYKKFTHSDADKHIAKLEAQLETAKAKTKAGGTRYTRGIRRTRGTRRRRHD